jgi:hypothetical protein
MAEPAETTWIDEFTETCLELEVADLLVGALHRYGMDVDGATAATVSADLVSLVTARTNDTVSRRLRSAFGSGMKKESDGRALAEQWIEHFEPQLRVLAGSNRLPLDFIRELARRRLRGDYAYGPGAINKALDELMAAGRLWGGWPDAESVPMLVRAWVRIGENEVAHASREWRDDGRALPSHALTPVTRIPVDSGFHCGVQVDLAPGQVIIIGIVKAEALHLYDDAIREWSERRVQNDDAEPFPSPPPTYRLAYVLTDAHTLLCVEGDERAYTIVDEYLYVGSLSLSELVGRVEQTLPDGPSRYPHGAEIIG